MADLLTVMADHQADFTLVLRRLCLVKTDNSSANGVVRALFDDPAAFDQWAARWRVRLGDEVNGKSGRQQPMLAANPAYIPRNHGVEEVIRAAEDHGDFAPFEKLHRVLQKPYDEQEAISNTRSRRGQKRSSRRPSAELEQTLWETDFR